MFWCVTQRQCNWWMDLISGIPSYPVTSDESWSESGSCSDNESCSGSESESSEKYKWGNVVLVENEVLLKCILHISHYNIASVIGVTGSNVKVLPNLRGSGDMNWKQWVGKGYSGFLYKEARAHELKDTIGEEHVRIMSRWLTGELG